MAKAQSLFEGAEQVFSSSEGLQLSGLPVTGRRLEETLNLMNIPQDGTSITLKFAHDGTCRTLVNINQSRELKGNVSVITKNNPPARFPLGKSGEVKVEGDFQILYTTNCGDHSRDVDVEITVVPNHPTETAKISYKITPVTTK